MRPLLKNDPINRLLAVFTFTIERQTMIGHVITLGLSNFNLLSLDGFIKELFNLTAGDTYNMIMMA